MFIEKDEEEKIEELSPEEAFAVLNESSPIDDGEEKAKIKAAKKEKPKEKVEVASNETAENAGSSAAKKQSKKRRYIPLPVAILVAFMACFGLFSYVGGIFYTAHYPAAYLGEGGDYFLSANARETAFNIGKIKADEGRDAIIARVDGKRAFAINEGNELMRYTLAGAKKGEALKIADDAVAFAITKNGKHIAYITTQSKLMLSDLKESWFVCEGATDFEFSKDDKKLLFLNADGFYMRGIKSNGKQDLIGEGVSKVITPLNEYKETYYIADSTLFYKAEGKAAVQLAGSVADGAYFGERAYITILEKKDWEYEELFIDDVQGLGIDEQEQVRDRFKNGIPYQTSSYTLYEAKGAKLKALQSGLNSAFLTIPKDAKAISFKVFKSKIDTPLVLSDINSNTYAGVFMQVAQLTRQATTYIMKEGKKPFEAPEQVNHLMDLTFSHKGDQLYGLMPVSSNGKALMAYNVSGQRLSGEKTIIEESNIWGLIAKDNLLFISSFSPDFKAELGVLRNGKVSQLTEDGYFAGYDAGIGYFIDTTDGEGSNGRVLKSYKSGSVRTIDSGVLTAEALGKKVVYVRDGAEVFSKAGSVGGVRKIGEGAKNLIEVRRLEIDES